MAGAGYKSWVGGERVDYDEFQTYIQDQVTPVFASTAARDAAITSPAEGMQCIVSGSVDRHYTYNGSAWVPTGWYSAGGRIGCSLRRAAAQAIGSGAQATITWDTEDQDTDGFIAVSATTITIPTGFNGLYTIGARIQTSGAMSTGALYLTVAGEIYGADWSPNATYGSISSGPYPLDATNTITLAAYNGSAGSLNFTGRITCYRIGP